MNADASISWLCSCLSQSGILAKISNIRIECCHYRQSIQWRRQGGARGAGTPRPGTPHPSGCRCHRRVIDGANKLVSELRPIVQKDTAEHNRVEAADLGPRLAKSQLQPRSATRRRCGNVLGESWNMFPSG